MELWPRQKHSTPSRSCETIVRFLTRAEPNQVVDLLSAGVERTLFEAVSLAPEIEAPRALGKSQEKLRRRASK